MPPASAPTRAPKTLLALVGGGLMALAPLSIDMYLTAFSAIAADLKCPAGTVQLSLAVFFAGVTVGQLVYGPLADRFGRKPPLLAGLAVYVLSAGACLWVGDGSQLVALRLFQAIGASAGMVISQALVHDSFPPQESGRMFSMLMLVMGVAPIVAPTLGGGLLALAGWRSIFGVLAAFGLVLLAAVAWLVPETGGAHAEVKLSRAFHVYGSLFTKPSFAWLMGARGFANACMFAYITAAPFVFVKMLGFSAQQFGLVFGLNALALLVGSQLNGWLLRRHSLTRLLAASMALFAVGALLIVASGFLPLSFWFVFPPLFVTLLALGMIMPNATALGLVGHGPHTGSASALAGSVMFGIAFLVSGAISALPLPGILPMTLSVAACACLAVAMYLAGRRHRRGPAAAAPA